MKVDEYLLKVSGGMITLPGELEIGSEVMVKIEGTVVKESNEDNQDGTVNRIYVVKGIIAEAIKI